MRGLWPKTTALFWESPILWLPVVCADLLAFCFTRLRTWQLINSFLLGHSALTGQAIPSVVHDSDRVDGEAVCLVFRNVTYERVAGTSRYLVAGRGGHLQGGGALVVAAEDELLLYLPGHVSASADSFVAIRDASAPRPSPACLIRPFSCSC
jgi:hypothetical protein